MPIDLIVSLDSFSGLFRLVILTDFSFSGVDVILWIGLIPSGWIRVDLASSGSLDDWLASLKFEFEPPLKNDLAVEDFRFRVLEGL